MTKNEALAVDKAIEYAENIKLDYHYDCNIYAESRELVYTTEELE